MLRKQVTCSLSPITAHQSGPVPKGTDSAFFFRYLYSTSVGSQPFSGSRTSPTIVTSCFSAHPQAPRTDNATLSLPAPKRARGERNPWLLTVHWPTTG